MADDLFTFKPEPKVQRNHPSTSRAAAEIIKPVTGPWRLAIFEFVRKRGSSTDHEIFQNWPSESENTLRPRRTELVDGGWLRDSGFKRPNDRGRLCTVWVLTGAAVENNQQGKA